MSVIQCNICGSNDLELIYKDAPDYITGHSFQVWQCKNCRAGITWPQPDDLSPYYPEKYRRYNPIILAILRFLYRLRVKKWSDKFPKPGVAFEMGCGDGLMLDTLRSLGWKVIGSERTPQSAYYPRHVLGLPIFVGGVDSIRPSGHFDLIYLFHVLEHLDDPLETLQKFTCMLKADGKLIIGVPNFSSWQAKLGREKWFHLDVPRHLTHYSLATLGFLLDRVGMKVESVGYVSIEHDLYGWVQSVLNRLDQDFNRLTCLFMQLRSPDLINVFQILFGAIIGLLITPIAAISWVLGQGGLIEVTAVKKIHYTESIKPTFRN
jgi:SAM-dependent methyltransferase